MSHVKHEQCCPQNPNRKYVNQMSGKIGSNQYTKAKRLGLPKPILSDESRIKLGLSGKNADWSEERRQKHSVSMHKAVLNNPDSYSIPAVSGRIKIQEYNGNSFHSKWEVDVAKWLDKNKILWERKVKPSEYFWDGRIHLYFPDFYLPTFDLYLEIKGREVDCDIAKWNHFKFKLKIIRASEIYAIRKGKDIDLTNNLWVCSSIGPEQRTHNSLVVGSNPTRPTIQKL